MWNLYVKNRLKGARLDSVRKLAISFLRDASGSDLGSSSGGGEKWLGAGSILNMELSGFPDRFDEGGV